MRLSRVVSPHASISERNLTASKARCLISIQVVYKPEAPNRIIKTYNRSYTRYADKNQTEYFLPIIYLNIIYLL